MGDEAPTNPEEEGERVMRTSVYLTRILFLLCGDDAGLWDTPHLFADFVRNETTPESLGSQLNELFRILSSRDAPCEIGIVENNSVGVDFEKDIDIACS